MRARSTRRNSRSRFSAAGKDLVNAIADPLRLRRAFVRRLRRPGACRKRNASSGESSSALAKARAEEETAATAVERAERALASARSAHPLTRRLSLVCGVGAGLGGVKRRRQRTKG